MSSDVIYKPLVNHYEIKVSLANLKTKKITLTIKKRSKSEIRSIEKQIEEHEVKLHEVEEIINEFGQLNPLKNELRFNIVKLKQIEGLSHNKVADRLDCSVSYIAMVMKEYKDFYYMKKGEPYEYINS